MVLTQLRRMSRLRGRSSSGLRVAAWLMIAVAVASGGADSGVPSDGSGGVNGEFRIGLPEAVPPEVELTFGAGEIRLNLPTGAVYPPEESVGALIQGLEVTALAPGREGLVIRLAPRVKLSSFAQHPSEVVLSFSGVSAEDDYRLGPDDRIGIHIMGPSASNTEYETYITKGGGVTIPMIGEIRAAGLTVEQLRAEVSERLSEDLFVDPQVDIYIVEHNSQWVMVMGEVIKGGKVPIRGRADLREILAEAGGLSAGAGETILIARGGDRQNTLTVERRRFETGETNPVVEHGDIVIVGRAEYCYVRGEVRSPGPVRVEHDITLQKALASAGGLTEWANAKGIQVFDGSDAAGAVVYNLKDIEGLRAPDPVLKGGQVIIVKRRLL